MLLTWGANIIFMPRTVIQNRFPSLASLRPTLIIITTFKGFACRSQSVSTSFFNVSRITRITNIFLTDFRLPWLHQLENEMHWYRFCTLKLYWRCHVMPKPASDRPIKAECRQELRVRKSWYEMKVKVQQIVWHNKEPVFSADFHPSGVLATAGADSEIKVICQFLICIL